MNYEKKSDDWLMKQSVKLFEGFSNIMTDEEIERLNELCDVEREIALREGKRP